MQIDLRVMELLSSKICHDLISPVSAINNGVELIEDIGGDVVDEAMKLIGDSAGQAARRLRLFRVAYGRAGSEANLPLREVRPIIEQYFIGTKVKMQWSETLELPEVVNYQGALKVLVNMIVLSEEVLAYGGEITLNRLEADDKIGCQLTVAGRNAQLSESFQSALESKTPIEELTPRTIQSYITGRFADHFGLTVSFRMPEADRLELTLSAAKSAYDETQTI